VGFPGTSDQFNTGPGFQGNLYVENDAVIEGNIRGPRIINAGVRITCNQPSCTVSGDNILARDGGVIASRNGQRPNEWTLHDGDVQAALNVEADRHVLAGGRVRARDGVFGQNGVFLGRSVAGAFEVLDSDGSKQRPASMAEWADNNRSVAYEAFRQLRVRTDGDTRLSLAAGEVKKIFPSAVKTFAVPVHDDGADDEQEAEEMTIDLTQLLYTQFAVTQDIINEKEATAKTNEGMAKTIADMNDTIEELKKANEAILGRIARLEQSAGPIEALHKVAQGLMAP